MSVAREEILGRIRAALCDVDGAPPVAIPREYRRAGAVPVDVDLFAERVADYKAEVHRVPAVDLAATVARLLGERGAHRIAVPPGLPPQWLPDGVEIARDEPALPVNDLDTLDGTLTGCRVGIAETGTIVLDGGPECGRRALTLVPDLHLCIVLTDQVVASVPDAINALDPARPLTFISGPSATSDIELERVEGVHGPRTLVVLLAD